MDLQDRNKKGFMRLLRSFKYASQGLKHVFIHEQNMQIHIGIACITVLAAWLLQLPLLQWVIILVVIGNLLVLEIMNTAIEQTVDLVTKEFHPIAKRAKDIAAAAVFVYSIFAVMIGLVLFLPPLVRFMFQ